MDSLFPRDAMLITPHFEHTGVWTDTDWQDFAQDLSDAMYAFYAQGAGKQVNVKIYDAEGTIPVLPVGNATAGAGQNPAASVPREVALCLSYYSGQNTPRRRGRLYVPVCAIGQSLTGRPNPTVRDYVGTLAQLLADAGGADIDWVVYSRLDGDARPVSNWWVDNEWDTVRSRGLRATDRTVGTVGE